MDPSPPLAPNDTVQIAEPGIPDWIVQIDKSLKSKASNDQRHSDKWSIYRVRTCVAELNRKAYQPQVVSFGPYHHDDEHLLPMEEHKRRALFCFLKRSGKPFLESLKTFLEALREVEQDLEESYDALDKKWKAGSGEGVAVSFLELMITDGCFMLEILRAAEGKLEGDYEDDDPIFSDHGKFHVMAYIKRDMLMLENQLPMKVLEHLVAVERDGEETLLQQRQGSEFIIGLILKFFQSDAPIERIGDGLHVLDVYRKSLLLPEEKSKNDQSQLQESKNDPSKMESEGDEQEIIRSATELHEHGIRFEKTDNSSLNDISFDRGVLRLPRIVVDDTTESVYLNLIAFEHFHVGTGNEVTSYVFLVDNLINTAQDVQLLQSNGIIQNAIGSDKKVADLFNSLCKDVTLEPNDSLNTVHTQVCQYCKKPWSAWKATLSHDYFKNPWSGLSVFAAIVLFGLTALQTAYTVIYK